VNREQAIGTDRPKRRPLLFLRQYLRNPLKVGAIAPSGQRLARAMVEALSPQPGETVVELGPGTGVFTRALIERGVAPDSLLLVEFDRGFAAHLRGAFPGVTVINDDAKDLPRILHSRGHRGVRRIISGLPFRSLPKPEGIAIARAIGEVLEPGGVLAQFSYFNIPPLPPAEAAAAGLHGSRGRIIMRNIPPAFVWCYTKHSGSP
jgi:phosphatidylethanolamine/phosphatidyl-N-methylethanolamine N-methyltransferase